MMHRLFSLIAVTMVLSVALTGCCKPEETGMRADSDSSVAMGSSADSSADSSQMMMGQGQAAMAIPTGRKSTSVAYIEKMGPEQVMAGQDFTYKVKVTNLTDMALSEVKVSELLPEGFEFVSASPSARRKGKMLHWTLGDMAPKASRTIEITGRAADSGNLLTCTDVTYKPSMLCMTVNAVKPQLALEMVGPVENILCDPIEYRLTVSNEGSGTARNVRISSDLPDGMRTLDGQTELMMNIGNLSAGQSVDRTIRARVDKPGKFAAQAHARADGNLKAESREVSTFVRTPVLVVTKEGPDVRYVGRPIEYTITVANTGDMAAENTLIEDTLAAGTEFVKASGNPQREGNSISWSLGTLQPGDKKQVKVTVRPGSIGRVSSVATATAYCAEDRAGASTMVKGIPAILLEVIDMEDPIELDSNVTYLINVTNQGSANGTGIQIVAELPEEMSYVSSRGPTNAQVDGRRITFQPLSNLAPKAVAAYRITCKAQSTGDVRMFVKLTSDQITKPVQETEATNLYE